MPRKRNNIPENYNAPLPTCLRELMKDTGHTQAELANYLGISRQSVSCYTDGSANPTPMTIIAIARFFNVSTDYLLGESKYTDLKVANLSVEDIGLSERATKALINLAQSGDSISSNKISVINLMLEDDGAEGVGTQLLSYIADYFSAPGVSEQLIQFTDNGVKIIDLDSDIVKNPPPNCMSANILYDKVLIDQIISALNGARYQFQFSSIADDVYTEREETNNVIPEDEDN